MAGRFSRSAILQVREEPDAVNSGKLAAHYQKAADHGVARAYVRLGDLAWSEGATALELQRLVVLRLGRRGRGSNRHTAHGTCSAEFLDRPENIKNAATRYKLALKEVGSAETIRHLRSGDKRGFVEIVQYLLGSTGYDIGSIDGIVGSKTVSALGQFCAAQGLTECNAEVEDAPLEAL